MRLLACMPLMLLIACAGNSSVECASSCMGCCSGGMCMPGNTNTACGKGGAKCQVCESCVDGKCSGMGCSPATCNGCCSFSGCVSPSQQSASACGVGGGACRQCSGGAFCQSGFCVQSSTCDSSCPGCCSAGGLCVEFANQTAAKCGSKGKLCAQCGSGQCVHGTCTGTAACSPSTCNGCCLPSGSCLSFAQQKALACGKNGTACTACTGAKACVDGSCQAGPTPSCNERCAGESDGAGGLCTSTQCSGCCQPGASGPTCVLGTLPTACGSSGQTCSNCTASGQTCVGKACSSACTPSCQGRCAGEDNSCSGTCTTNTCTTCCYKVGTDVVCLLGTDSWGCGSGGGTCTDCTASGKTCVNKTCTSSCVPKCSDACIGEDDSCGGTCKTNTCSGCCFIDYSSTYCIAGSKQTDFACGSWGAVCSDCTSDGKTCVNKTCTSSCVPKCSGACIGEDDSCGGTCKINTCSGCCFVGPTSTYCMTGTSDGACGKNGNTCESCDPGWVCDYQQCVP